MPRASSPEFLARFFHAKKNKLFFFFQNCQISLKTNPSWELTRRHSRGSNPCDSERGCQRQSRHSLSVWCYQRQLCSGGNKNNKNALYTEVFQSRTNTHWPAFLNPSPRSCHPSRVFIPAAAAPRARPRAGACLGSRDRRTGLLLLLLSGTVGFSSPRGSCLSS